MKCKSNQCACKAQVSSIELHYSLFLVNEPNEDVIKDFSVSLILTSFSEVIKLISDGINRKVTKIETLKPKVIIQPKSIIGLIPLKTKGKKAQIVVSTV